MVSDVEVVGGGLAQKRVLCGNENLTPGTEPNGRLVKLPRIEQNRKQSILPSQSGKKPGGQVGVAPKQRLSQSLDMVNFQYLETPCRYHSSKSLEALIEPSNTSTSRVLSAAVP